MVQSVSAFLYKHEVLSSALQESSDEFVIQALEADGKKDSWHSLAKHLSQSGELSVQ